ncbi:phosphoenolpyruvate phosphomutase-domain-containing protein [Cladochytrium replicatum]|nr:phosphoenolpyruvate phosphomutase-domain-containing protein [Cladochytrium replicatum]
MALNDHAVTLKALHVPSNPIVFTNIWDLPSLNALLSLNKPDHRPVRAVATASWAIAASLGIADEDLSAEQNLALISRIGPICRAAGVPLTVDIQDGYGDKIESVVAAVVRAGASGANIEDSIPSAGFGKGIEGSLYSLETQLERLKAALRAANEAGCPDFVINARCDIFRLDERPGFTDEVRMKEAIKRGKAFLDAGATTVFLWGGARGIRTAEVETLVKELGGRVAVKLARGPSALTPDQLSKIGVARISVGPDMFRIAMEALKVNALAIYDGTGLPAPPTL